MNILIVDDEILAIENVENALKTFLFRIPGAEMFFVHLTLMMLKVLLLRKILISYFAILRCRTGMELTWCAGSMKADIIWNVL